MLLRSTGGCAITASDVYRFSWGKSRERYLECVPVVIGCTTEWLVRSAIEDLCTVAHEIMDKRGSKEFVAVDYRKPEVLEKRLVQIT